jgi:hypothetical protein
MFQEFGFSRFGVVFALACVVSSLSACKAQRSNSFTLYRNSHLDYSMRVHWATFDTNDKGSYNMNNCLMAARLLNANVTARAKAEGKERDQILGFWCEGGTYQEHGTVPTSFSEAFPTDA